MKERLSARGNELLVRATELGFVISENATPMDFLFEMVMQLAECIVELEKSNDLRRSESIQEFQELL